MNGDASSRSGAGVLALTDQQVALGATALHVATMSSVGRPVKHDGDRRMSLYIAVPSNGIPAAPQMASQTTAYRQAGLFSSTAHP